MVAPQGAKCIRRPLRGCHCVRTYVLAHAPLCWLLLGLPSAAVRAAERPVASLPAHLAESGIPTAERGCPGRRWLKAIAAGQEAGPSSQPWFDGWIGGGLPFSFRYDGQDFAGAGKAWKFQRGEVQPRGGCRNAGLELAARQDRPEGRLAHQAVSRLSGRRYAPDVREHRQQGYGLDRGRGKPRSEVESYAAGKERTRFTGPTAAVAGCDDFMPFSQTVHAAAGRPNLSPAVVDAASPGRRKTGDRQIDPQDAA